MEGQSLVTILEYCNSNEEWIFYAVYATRNPKNACINYLMENNLTETEKEAKSKVHEGETGCIVDNCCRAFEVELE